MERVQDNPSLFPHVQCPTPDKDRLLQLAAEWRDLIDARGRDEEYAAGRHMQVCQVLEAAGYVLSDSKVQISIGQLQKSGLSNCTCCKYLASIKSFSKWLARPSARVIPFDPLSELRGPSAKRDPRHIRDSFWPVLERLLTVTERSTRDYKGISGPDRAELYHAAACTGLREGTLTVVEVGQFHLDALPVAYVKVRGDQVKDGEDLTVPIQPDSAARLRAYLSGKMPTARAFRTPRYDTEFIKMLKKDLAEAEITYCREVQLANGKIRRENVLDFHALRKTFGSWCATAGVELTTTQKWMGHSDPALTANHYTHIIPAAEVAAVMKLPPLPGVKRAS